MVSAVVLAAGLSTRMGGRPKALLPYDARDTFVTRIVRTFAEAAIPDIVVVVGHQSDAVRAAVRACGIPARCVTNPSYADGQLSSILTGLTAVESVDPDAMLLALVDAPAFSSSTVRALIERFEQRRLPVVRAVRAEEHGHPVLISRDLFPEIRRADPSRGAKPIVRAHASAAGDVTVDDPGAFVDVDTPAEYQQLFDRVRRGDLGPR